MGIGYEHAVSYPELGGRDEEDENHSGIAGRDSDAADVGGSGLAERAEAGERWWDRIDERDGAWRGSWAGRVQRGYAGWAYRERADELGVGDVDAVRWGAGCGWESAVSGKYSGSSWERFAWVFVGVFADKRDEAGEQRCDGVSECDCARGEFRACGVHGFLSGGPHGGRANHLGIGQLCAVPNEQGHDGQPTPGGLFAFARRVCVSGVQRRRFVLVGCPADQSSCC